MITLQTRCPRHPIIAVIDCLRKYRAYRQQSLAFAKDVDTLVQVVARQANILCEYILTVSCLEVQMLRCNLLLITLNTC